MRWKTKKDRHMSAKTWAAHLRTLEKKIKGSLMFLKKKMANLTKNL